MSRAKLFNMIKSRGEKLIGRNSFDLSNRHVYSQKVAKIYPIKALHTIPKDFFNVSVTEFSQNNIPLNTAAFLSGKKELLAYFVPYNSIWHNFNQYQATREDPESAALKVKGISFEPRFSLFDLYNSALYFTIGAWYYESFVQLLAPLKWYNIFRNDSDSEAWSDFSATFGADNSATLAELVDFMKNANYLNDSVSDWEVCLRECAKDVAKLDFHSFHSTHSFPFGISHDCFEHYVEHKQDLTYGDTILNLFGTPIWCDWIMKLDMLRYGNIYPILRPLRNSLDKEIDVIMNDSQIIVNNTNFFYRVGSSSLYKDFLSKVITTDYESYNEFYKYVQYAQNKIISSSTVRSSGDSSDDEFVNVYALFAYNKCFYDYMRNVYFDTDYSVYNYNCDFVDCTDWELSIIRRGYLPCRFYHLECHQWKKDMFTGALPSNQLGNVSQVVLDVSVHSDLTTFGPDYTAGSSSSVSTSGGSVSGTARVLVEDSKNRLGVSSTGFVDNQAVRITTPHTHLLTGFSEGRGSFDVLSLKRAEVIQQYAQDLMRAGNRTRDIFNQIYGSSPKSQMDETPYFIDVASSDLNINPIVSTASTGNENNGKLGDIAARALIDGRSNPLSFKFSTEDFGVILFLSYIIPESMYNSYNLDPCVTHLDPESHYIPYFQNLGLQPVIGSYLNNLKPISIRSRVCGYAPPYIERKTDIDLVHGNLVDTFLPKVGEHDIDSEYQGDLSHWVVARTDMQQEDTVSLRNFYIDPRIVDNVFQFNADSDLSTDHFLTYAVLKIDSVRALSEIGLPRF